MSGWVTCHSACCCCGRLFGYNPHHVPSTRAFSGEREPICSFCFDRINAKRRARGEKPFPLHPEAYEPLPEEELE